MADINSDVDVDGKTEKSIDYDAICDMEASKMLNTEECKMLNIEASKMLNTEASKVSKSEDMQVRLLLMANDISVITVKEGENMNRLREKYDVDIQTPGIHAASRVLSIIGSLDNVINVIKELLPCTTRAQYPTNQPCAREINLLVHTNTVGTILGKGGTTIKGIREGTNTKIKVYKECLASSNERVIAIGANEEEHILLALKKIMNISKNFPKVYTYVPVNKPSEIQPSGMFDRIPSIQNILRNDEKNGGVNGITREGYGTHNRYNETDSNRDQRSYSHQTTPNTYSRYIEIGNSPLDQPADYHEAGYSTHNRYSETGNNRDQSADYCQPGYRSHKTNSETGSDSDFLRPGIGYSAHNREQGTGSNLDHPSDYRQAGYSSQNRYNESKRDQPSDYGQVGYSTYYRDRETGSNRDHPIDFLQTGDSTLNRYGESGSNRDQPSDYGQMGYSTHQRDREFLSDTHQAGYSTHRYVEQGNNREYPSDLFSSRDSETCTNRERTSDFHQVGYNSTYRDTETGTSHDYLSDSTRGGHNTTRRESEIGSDSKHPSDLQVGYDTHRYNEMTIKGEHTPNLPSGYNTQRDTETGNNCEDTSAFLQAATETKLIVPNDMCGAIIGKGGIRIREIRNTSGAKINFSESNKQVKQDRIIVITGTQQQVQSAEKLMTQAARNRNN